MNDKQDVVDSDDDEKRAAAERARLRAVLVSQINIYDDPVSSGAVSCEVTEGDIGEAIAESFDRMIREDPGVLVARLRDALECELPEVDLDETDDEPETEEDKDEPVDKWWPKKKLRGVPVSVRGSMALFVVKSDFDRGEHGRLLERVKAGVANEWRVQAADIWHVEVKSLHAHQWRTYLLHPDMRGTLILNPTSEQSEMLCEMLWRLGGERRMLDVVRKNPWLATTPPKGTPTHKVVGMDLSVPLGLWSMLMIRDGVEDKLDQLLPRDLGWETCEEELLEGCVEPQAKTEDNAKDDKRGMFQDALLRVEIFDEREVLAAKRRLDGLPDETRRRLSMAYDRLLEGTPHRRLVPAPHPSALDVMKRFPNAARLTSFIQQQVALRRLHGGALAFPPILMAGPPGVGKTEYCHALADALGLGKNHEVISMATTSASFVLSGMSSGWSGSKPGVVSSKILFGEVGNPLFIADEVDKATGDARYSPIMSLLSLLERTTARTFADEFYDGVRLDASHVLWLATANDLSTVPDPILSRFVVFKVDALDVEQTRSVASSMYQQMMEEPIGNYFSPDLPVDVLDGLQIMTPRELRLSLTRALGRAALRPHSGGLRHLSVEDLMTDEPTIASRGIGFCAAL